MEFREKEGYKPEVKLEYVDDAGRTMTPKEAFRMLSHRFHGKGSGKRKTEKRMKKFEEDQVLAMFALNILCFHLRNICLQTLFISVLRSFQVIFAANLHKT